MERSTLSSVVWGTDFSECSRRARTLAVEYARRFAVPLHIVHVSGWLHGGDEDALVRAEAASIEAVPVISKVVFGSPAAELARYARECAASLIVVGTHGRSGFSHLILGSTAERLLRLAHCPVLVVPPLDAPVAAVVAQSPEARRCLVCSVRVDELICESCRAQIRGEAITHQQEEARRARV